VVEIVSNGAAECKTIFSREVGSVLSLFSGNALVLIKVVALRWARLVLDCP